MVKPCEAIAFVEQPCMPKGLWAVNALHLPLLTSSISMPEVIAIHADPQ